MDKKADITIDLDARCIECGAKGAAQNGLCLPCITKKIKKGGTMGISIELSLIEELVLKAKGGKVIIQFETRISPGDFARLMNLQKKGNMMSAVIESPQAQLDLKFEEINVATGELAEVNR